VSAFEKWFEAQWPSHAAVIKMYEEKSPAVDYMDAMIPLRTKQTAQKAWNAALEHAAKVCFEFQNEHTLFFCTEGAQGNPIVPAVCASAIRMEIEK